MPGEATPGRQLNAIQGTFLVPGTDTSVLFIESALSGVFTVYSLFVFAGGIMRKRRISLHVSTVTDAVLVKRIERGKKFPVVIGPFLDAAVHASLLSINTFFDVLNLVSLIDKTAIAWLTENTDGV